MKNTLLLTLLLLAGALRAEDPPLFQYIKSVKLDQMIADCGTILLNLWLKDGAEKTLPKDKQRLKQN